MIDRFKNRKKETLPFDSTDKIWPIGLFRKFDRNQRLHPICSYRVILNMIEMKFSSIQRFRTLPIVASKFAIRASLKGGRKEERKQEKKRKRK